MSKDKVVDIRSKQPHMTGPAVCLNCKKEWIAVAETGTISLECPDCHTSRGVWRGIALPKHGEIWECNCGGTHFFLASDYFHCCHCGLAQEFNDEFDNAS